MGQIPTAVMVLEDCMAYKSEQTTHLQYEELLFISSRGKVECTIIQEWITFVSNQPGTYVTRTSIKIDKIQLTAKTSSQSKRLSQLSPQHHIR